MIKKLLSIVFLLGFINAANAQSVSITANASTTQVNGLGYLAYHVSEYIYTDTEIGASNFVTAGTAINKINLNATVVGTPNFMDNVKIYMKNIPAGTTALTAGTYSTVDYTEVFSGTFTGSAAGWVGVSLTTPFVRTAGTNLQIMLERTDNVDHSSATAIFTWASANGNNLSSTATTSRRYNGTAALTGSTALSASAFRVAIQLQHAFATDLGVDKIETLGTMLAGVSYPHSIKAFVTNYGTNTIPAGTNVTLNVSGSNTFTNTQLTNSLAAGTTQTIVFAAIPTAVVGNNTITVTVPNDDNIANSSATTSQLVTSNGFGYPNSDAINVGGIGFNTGSGLLVVSHRFPMGTNISGVKVFLKTGGNTIFGVLTNSVGEIIAQTTDYNVQLADSNNYVTLSFASPFAMAADSTFFIGIGQKVGAYGYFPMATQPESPARANTYASIPLAGGVATYYTTLNRFMIEGVASVFSLPLQLTAFSGKLNANTAQLNWSTTNEVNTSKFIVERSNNNNWNSIATVDAKGEKNNTYQITDANLAIGKYQYRLKMMDKDGKFTYSSIVLLEVSSKNLFVLNQNYPNPVKGSTALSYQLSEKGKVSIELFTQDGRKVASIINAQQSAGTYNVSIDVKKYALATGNYNYRMVVVNNNNQEVFRATKTMVIAQ